MFSIFFGLILLFLKPPDHGGTVSGKYRHPLSEDGLTGIFSMATQKSFSWPGGSRHS